MNYKVHPRYPQVPSWPWLSNSLENHGDCWEKHRINGHFSPARHVWVPVTHMAVIRQKYDAQLLFMEANFTNMWYNEQNTCIIMYICYMYISLYNHVTIWYHFEKHQADPTSVIRDTPVFLAYWSRGIPFLGQNFRLLDLGEATSHQKITDWNCWIYPAVSVCHKIPFIFETSGTRRARQARPPPWRSEGRGDQPVPKLQTARCLRQKKLEIHWSRRWLILGSRLRPDLRGPQMRVRPINKKGVYPCTMDDATNNIESKNMSWPENTGKNTKNGGGLSN